MQIQDRVFIVTGSGSGLGAATAQRLVSAGARVLLADLNIETGNAQAAQLGSNAQFQQTDVADAASAEAAVAACASAFGALHGLVNCAEVAPSEKVLGREGPHQLQSFARTIQRNLIGRFNMLRLDAGAVAAPEPAVGGERGGNGHTDSDAPAGVHTGQA